MPSLKRSRSQGGFTLTELMIVVALIGVLAAIAIPNFIAYQARSRRSEAYSNLAAVALAYKAYAAEKGDFPDMFTVSGAVALPDDGLYGGLGTEKMPWDPQTKTFFDNVGFQVEGSVFYTYDINSNCPSDCTSCFTATAHGDVDGDGVVAAVMFVHPQLDAAGSVIGSCKSTMFNYAGPIRDGTPVYNEPAVYYGAGDEY